MEKVMESRERLTKIVSESKHSDRLMRKISLLFDRKIDINFTNNDIESGLLSIYMNLECGILMKYLSDIKTINRRLVG